MYTESKYLFYFWRFISCVYKIYWSRTKGVYPNSRPHKREKPRQIISGYSPVYVNIFPGGKHREALKGYLRLFLGGK